MCRVEPSLKSIQLKLHYLAFHFWLWFFPEALHFKICFLTIQNLTWPGLGLHLFLCLVHLQIVDLERVRKGNLCGTEGNIDVGNLDHCFRVLSILEFKWEWSIVQKRAAPWHSTWWCYQSRWGQIFSAGIDCFPDLSSSDSPAEKTWQDQGSACEIFHIVCISSISSWDPLSLPHVLHDNSSLMLFPVCVFSMCCY